MNYLAALSLSFGLLLSLTFADSQLLGFGYFVPTSLTNPVSTPLTNQYAFFVNNIVFNGTYCLIAYAFYAASSGIVEIGIDTWLDSGGYSCFQTNPISCAENMNSYASMWPYDYTYHNGVNVSATQGYNYYELAVPILVNNGDSVQIKQSSGIVAIDDGQTAPHTETAVAVSGSSLTITKLNSTYPVRFYMMAYATVSGYKANGTCSNYYGSSQQTTTTTTTTTTAKQTTTTEIMTTTSTVTTTAAASTTTTTANPTTITTSSSTSTISTSSIVNFNPQLLASLIESNYTGDLSGCLVNCTLNGVCYFNQTTNQIGCVCNHNFTGTACQTDLRPCASSPCSNSATCIDDVTLKSFTCKCSSSFYYGSMCEYKVNVCANETCSSQGSCSDVNNTATCSCFESYSGSQCENEAESLALTKKLIQSTSIIAFICIVLFYLIFVLSDVHSWWFIGRKRRRRRQQERQQKQNPTIRRKLIYIN